METNPLQSSETKKKFRLKNTTISLERLKEELNIQRAYSTKPNAIIVDIDGTLADMGDRRDPFEYGKMMGDTVNIPIREIIKSLSKDYYIIIVTGRPKEYESLTRHWLLLAGIDCYDHIYMRQTDDRRPSFKVKKDIYERDIQPFYNVVMVFDDRKQDVDMYRGLGLLTCQVADNNS